MDVRGFEFSFVSKIEAERDAAGKIITWTPKEKYYKDNRPILKSGRGPFAFLNLSNVPSDTGVYAVVKNDREVMFVGATTDSLLKRWGKGAGFTSIPASACFKGGQPTFSRVNHLIAVELEEGNHISLWVLVTKDPGVIKKKITGVRLPPWNINL
jgi:hypothetical protein